MTVEPVGPAAPVGRKLSFIEMALVGALRDRLAVQQRAVDRHRHALTQAEEIADVLSAGVQRLEQNGTGSLEDVGKLISVLTTCRSDMYEPHKTLIARLRSDLGLPAVDAPPMVEQGGEAVTASPPGASA